MSDQIVRTSKFLSLILRHDPSRIGLTLDAHGWASVEELIRCANNAGHKVSRELLERVVAENNKQRFTWSSDGSQIRANQGHSVSVDLELVPRVPPDVLYHGTASRFLDSIQRTGLESRSRQHVHLSVDRETAINVGRRHGKPVVLIIDAQRMASALFEFYLSENGVWLTRHVPTDFIKFP